jgi:hypothetical protein
MFILLRRFSNTAVSRLQFRINRDICLVFEIGIRELLLISMALRIFLIANKFPAQLQFNSFNAEISTLCPDNSQGLDEFLWQLRSLR